jgi:hypothetical protein
MRKLTLEGEQGLRDLQQTELWGSIMAKKQFYEGNMNAFMNSLSEDEFTEFI